MITTTDVNLSTERGTTADSAQGWFLVGCLGATDRVSQIHIGKVPFTIGRAASNDFCLPANNVSKFHADIIVAVDAVLVRDLDSKNGTFVNGKRIVAPTPVGVDDLLQFADMEFRLGRANTGLGERTDFAAHPE